MPGNKSVKLQSWLDTLCGMIPGISQAVLLNDSYSEKKSFLQWPLHKSIHQDVITTADLAFSQKKTVTTTLSLSKTDDQAVEMVIAVPLIVSDNFLATLAVLVKIKPSQQSAIMQIIHWG